MKQNLFFVLIAIAILYLIYSFSKNTPKQLHKKKLVKETFNQLGNVATEIDDYSVTFLDQELDQEMDPEYWRRLNSNLVFSNSNLLIEITNLEERLKEVRLDIIQFTSNNDYLTREIDKLKTLNESLVEFILQKSGCETNNPKYGISNCDYSHILDVDTMQNYKNTLKTTFKNLVDKLNTMLVHDHYNELDAGTLELSYGSNVQVQHIQRIINNLESIQKAYYQFYQHLQVSPETPETDTWDTTASTIMTKAKINCENRFIEDKCIYATQSNGITTGYYTSNMNYAFHSNLWPSEDSCEQDPEGNCHSIGELSSSNCDGNKKTCYDLISDDDVNSSHHNNNDKLGHISYNSNSYTYTSEPLPNVEGQWSCELNYPSQENRGHTCKTESNITHEARDNCEGGQSSWGVASYDCYTNTNTNESNDFATYSGAEELPSVSSQKGSGRSKVWSNTSNDDGSFGTCTVDDTCRTVAETSNMATCLTQVDSNDYTNNYRCYGTSGTNTGISNVSKSNYRNKYEVGSFDSNRNVWSSDGTCYEAHSNYIDCRTKADVDAEVAWKTSNNWQCHTYSNGEVNALEQWNKNYEVNTVFTTDSNIGTKSYTSECRKKEDSEAYKECVTTKQYSCWEDQGSNVDSNIKKQYSKQDTKNKNYTELSTTSNDSYAAMTRSNFDDNCATSDCKSMNDALTNVTNHCQASNIRSTCYKDGTASSNQFGDEVSWSIVYDSITNPNFEQYSTRVVETADHIQCVERAEGECSSKSNVCESKSNKCYTLPTTYDSNASSNFFDMTSPSNFTYQSSMLDSSGSNCVPNNCVTLPYCSYITVETNNSNEFVWDNIGVNDCIEPSDGKRYRWTLETNSDAAASNPGIFIDTDDTRNSGHWRQVNTDTSSNSSCTPVDGMVGNDVQTITNEANGSNILCQCDPSKPDHYGLRYYAGSFDTNTPSNIGHSTLEGLQSSNCESDECRARNYYTAQERLVECTHPEELASNTQGELGLGEKYLDINLVENGLLCYNNNACSNLCLVSGPTNNFQIGDGIYDTDTEAQSDPAQCYSYGSSNQQNRFSYDSYAANGSLLTNMPTCTDLVGEECSSNQNDNCGYPDSGISWSNKQEVTNTRNKSNTTITINHEPEHIYVDTPVSKSRNQITYNTQCANANSTNDTPMKALFKYTRVVPVNDDRKCIVQSSNITQIKYTVENLSGVYCPQNCRGSWSGCTYDRNRHRNIKTWTTSVAGAHGGTLCTFNTGDVKTSGCQQPIDCEFNSYGDWSSCPTCGTGAGLTVTRTRTKTGPQYNGRDCVGSLTQSDYARCSHIKPCCTQSYYGGWTSESGTPSNWNGSDNPPCETTYTRSKRLDTTRCTNTTTRLPETVTDSKTNSQPCNVDCGLGQWTQSGTCPTDCGYVGGNKEYTAEITTPKLGTGNTCIAVAGESPPQGGSPSYSKNGSTVTATYTGGCPSTLPCCKASEPSHYKENSVSYIGGTEAQFNNVALAPCNIRIDKMRNYVRDESVCKDGVLKDPTLVQSKNTMRCCTNNDFRANVNYTANPPYTPPRGESLERHFYDTNKMPCSTTITKTTSYSKRFACKGDRDDTTLTKTSRDCDADNVIATNANKFQQFLIQQSYGNKSSRSSIPLINQNIRDYNHPVRGNLDLTNISNNPKYIYWQSNKVFTLWVGSYVGCEFYYRNVRVDFSVGNNDYHIILGNTRNRWSMHEHSDGTHHYPTRNNYGKCLARFKTSNESGKRIKSIKVTADVKRVYGGALSNPGNGFWICTDKANNGSTCTAPLIETRTGRSSPS
jgi:hypothetical protein